MKTALYVAVVARTCREAIDDYYKAPELYASKIEHYKEEIAKCTYRQFTTGFFYGKTTSESQLYENNTYTKGYTYLGLIGNRNAEGLYGLEQRNKFCVGETIEIMKPNHENIEVVVKRIVDEEGNEMESCPHPKQKIYVDLGVEMDSFDILRKKEEK